MLEFFNSISGWFTTIGIIISPSIYIYRNISKRLDDIEKRDHLELKAMYDMMEHIRTGNHEDDMKKTQEEIPDIMNL